MSFLHEDEIPEDPLECAMHLKTNILGLTTSGGSDAAYRAARTQLMQDAKTKSLLPDFVRLSMDSNALSEALSAVASGPGSWVKRRAHVHEGFAPFLSFLETGPGAADATITNGLVSYDAPAVQAVWTKALDRRSDDPEGAVTAASTLLEEVCKHIIEDNGGTWEAKWNTPKLYSEASQILNLAPTQHQAEIFKTILGNCQSIVQGIGTLRNRDSDAHAGGRTKVRLKPRHAALAVNLAGGMALFLIETWQETQPQRKGVPVP